MAWIFLQRALALIFWDWLVLTFFFWSLLLFPQSNRCWQFYLWFSAFTKTSLNIWKFTVHVLIKPGLEILSITLLSCESEIEVAQSCLTLWDPEDCSPSGSSIHGIFQAIILEWVVISFSRGSSQPRDQIQASRTAGRHFNLWATREVIFPSTLLGSWLRPL